MKQSKEWNDEQRVKHKMKPTNVQQKIITQTRSAGSRDDGLEASERWKDRGFVEDETSEVRILRGELVGQEGTIRGIHLW